MKREIAMVQLQMESEKAISDGNIAAEAQDTFEGGPML